jgi:aspartate/methionine/tyrosine aminotransferase
MTKKYSDYMNWAKTQSRARFNLATSGVGAFPMEEFPHVEMQINGDNSYGFAPLTGAIATKHGVDPDCVVTISGTSGANYLAMATLLDPGDEALIEQPGYELIVAAARYIGADVKRFVRREEEGYALNPAEVAKVLTPKTKLIIVTNLHNPSSALATDAELAEVGSLARSVGARVLVDEVYLDAVYENTPRTSFHLGPEFVVTSSLTKVYGLSGLRCGWILARPDLARAMWRLNDLFAATPVHPGELMSVAAFQNLERIRRRSREIVETDRTALGEFLDRQTRFIGVRTKFGTTSFLRLKGGGVDAFLERLRTELETSAVPGRFFDRPDHLRIGMGVNSEVFREGLRRLEL